MKNDYTVVHLMQVGASNKQGKDRYLHSKVMNLHRADTQIKMIKGSLPVGRERIQ